MKPLIADIILTIWLSSLGIAFCVVGYAYYDLINNRDKDSD